MLLADVVAASQAVAATRSRKAKVAALAEALGRAGDEAETVTSYLAGVAAPAADRARLAVDAAPCPRRADSPLTVGEVHATFDEIAALSGPGSQKARAEALADLFGRATADEQQWLRRRSPARCGRARSDSLVQEGLAAVGGVPLAAVRRAAMMAGSTVAVAAAALTGGEEALAVFVLEVGRPVLPMLASSATSVEAAMEKAGGGTRSRSTPSSTASGSRCTGGTTFEAASCATRSLEVITGRLPEVVAVALALPAERFVLDGEVLALDDAGRPRPFQETASRTAMAADEGGVHLTPYFFDLLHLDGTDHVDSPGSERLAALDRLLPEEHRIARLVTDDPAAAETFVRDVLDRGHEGVVVKNLAATYDAGRRGSAWVKVKPVHTLDLVVLAVEWGSGRRKGWLSNIHLGARDDSSTVAS